MSPSAAKTSRGLVLASEIRGGREGWNGMQCHGHAHERQSGAAAESHQRARDVIRAIQVVAELRDDAERLVVPQQTF